MGGLKFAAVILAAGRSSRMGAPKALLPLGKETALARSVRLFRETGCDQVIVALGHEAERLRPEAEAAGAETVLNPNYDKGMFSSVLVGLEALSAEAEAVFILPVDVPLVRPATVIALGEALERQLAGAPPGPLAVRPTVGGVPGHPPCLARAALPFVLGHDGAGGLAGALEKLPGGLAEAAVADEGALVDMDRPWDYLRVLVRLARLDVPRPAECAAFFATLPDKGRAHARAVAARAEAMARAVNARRRPGERLDLELVRAAALLHDVAKGEPGHEAAGGRLLAAWGFDKAAAIVAAHKDPVPAEGRPVTEREIVALADKLVRCDRPVSIEERFGEKLRRYGHDPEAAAAIARRRDNALRTADRVEAAMGRSLDDLFSEEA